MSNHSYTHKCLNILGNELRLNIIAILQKKELTVTQLCDNLDKEQSAVSHALQQLRHCSFVDYKKKGKERVYFLKSKIFEENDKPIFELVSEHIETYCKGKC
jgi:ArsR family transcriptional regulator, lead/cadmium/zinc/bismuth-responsive transcriptional repressor